MNIVTDVDLRVGVVAICEIDDQATPSLSLNILDQKLSKISIFMSNPKKG